MSLSIRRIGKGGAGLQLFWPVGILTVPHGGHWPHPGRFMLTPGRRVGLRCTDPISCSLAVWPVLPALGQGGQGISIGRRFCWLALVRSLESGLTSPERRWLSGKELPASAGDA